MIRGYGRIRDKDVNDSDDDNSEEDVDDSLAAVLMNQVRSATLFFFSISKNDREMTNDVMRCAGQQRAPQAAVFGQRPRHPLQHDGVPGHPPVRHGAGRRRRRPTRRRPPGLGILPSFFFVLSSFFIILLSLKPSPCGFYLFQLMFFSFSPSFHSFFPSPPSSIS